MKVVALFEGDLASGGAFQQALNAILQMQRLSVGNFDFAVLTPVERNVEDLAQLGVQAVSFKLNLFDRQIGHLFSSQIVRKLQSRRRWKLVHPLEKLLMDCGTDLVYFPQQPGGEAFFQNLNYITMVWDLCHRDTPEFPEIRGHGVFTAREKEYLEWLPPAFAILVDSQTLATRIAKRYGIDEGRLLVMPFAPAPFLCPERSLTKEEVARVYALDEGYYFYPAQLWPHKNHVRILEALALLASKGINRKVVFAGGDKGNLRHLLDTANQLKIEKHVKVLGFVPVAHMRGLYEGCGAVVMPTYFGPTNLPPLEAWTSRRPLIYSEHLAEHAMGAALLVNPDDATSLAGAMVAVLDPIIAADLVAKGNVRLEQINEQRESAEQQLLAQLKIFAARRRCWI